MVKIGDRVQIYETYSNYYGRCGIVIGDDFCPTFPYKVEFEDGDDCIFKGKDLIVLSTEEEKVMKFKVGDRVRIGVSCMNNNGKEGVISEVDGSSIPYKVTLDDGGTEWKHPGNITKLEEKVMKFKVGDKVKVKDSWFGHDGQVGVVFRTDNCGPFNYSVKFDVEGNNGRRDENFKGDSLELAKQQFTKSDLKTGMGVVLRDGTKGHVLLDTVAGDVIRFINERSNQWGSVDEYDENMIDCDMSAMDIVEVYSSKYAYCYLTDRVFNQDCVFKREEPKSEPKPEPKPEPEPTKMTMKEINEHFGKAIEIIE